VRSTGEGARARGRGASRPAGRRDDRGARMTAKRRITRAAWPVLRLLVLWLLITVSFAGTVALLPGIHEPSFRAARLTTALIALLDATAWTEPGEPIVGAGAMHEAIRGWLSETGLDLRLHERQTRREKQRPS